MNAVFTTASGEVIYADIMEVRKYTLKLKLPDGNEIIKKHKQVSMEVL